MKELLQLTEVDIKEGRNYRLKNINLTIRKGDKIALLGKSGSGKSTLISVANGSIPPSNGTVKWQKKSLKYLNRFERRNIGTIWQDLRLIEELNVQQNINSGILAQRNILWAIRNILGNIESKQCIECLLNAKLSEEFANKQIHALSGGQKQRVAIARLLRQKAKLILADEPLCGLDPILSKEILDLLLGQVPSKTLQIPDASLISLHNPKLIKAFSRIVFLKQGELILDTPTKDLKESELKLFYNL